MTQKTDAQHIADLNRLTPAARDAALGQVIADLIAQNNALVADLGTMRTKLNATLTKLDGDTGVAATDYNSTNAMPALTATSVALLSTR